MLHPMTDYFRDEVLAKRPYIQLDWCMRALANPIRTEVQPEDGRIRHWNHMRLSYDPNTDSLYIHLTEKPSVDSDEVARGVVLDFDNEGGIVGIDVQHASQHAEIHQLMLHQMPLSTISIAAPPGQPH
jgi:uncharacterized protein YuzE